MKKTVIILMLLTVTSKILGFTRDITLSYFYGASIISDVYLISLAIPTVIFAIIGKGISTGFIPMYIHIESNRGTERANHFTNNIVNIVIVLCTIILIFGVLFTEPIVKLFASGFEGETLSLAVNFTRITLAGIYFIGLNYVFSAFLQTKEVFIIPAFIGLPANVIMIGSFFFSSQSNLYVLALGSLIAVGSQFLFISFYGYRNNFRYRPSLDIKNRDIKKMSYLALPAILGSSVAQINILVDKTIASRIAEGGISALNYASTLNLFVIGIIVTSIITVLFPKITKLAEEKNIVKMKKTLSYAINAVNLFILPSTVGYMIFAEPIVLLLFGRGEFDAHALSMTSYALFFYSIGLVGVSLKEILSNAFFSLHDTKTPTIISTIAVAMNIILNFILSRYLGLGGLALATSISAIVGSLLLLFSLRRRIGSIGLHTMLWTVSKIMLASFVMGVLSKLAYSFLINNFSISISLLLAICLGILVYSTLVYFMKIDEVNMIVFEIKKYSSRLQMKKRA